MRVLAATVLIACGAPTTATAPPPMTRPPPVAPVAKSLVISTAPVIQLAIAPQTTCALHADGAVSCWGGLDDPGLSYTTWASATPVPLVAPGDAIQISAALGVHCILRRSGAVACWGELGHDTRSETPVAIAAPPAVQLSGPCSRARDGAITCISGQRGPERVPGVAGAVELSARSERGCAVIADGRVTCWQRPNWDDPFEPAVVVAGITTAVQVAVGDSFACARLTSGDVSCWGIEFDGQLGRGHVPPIEEPSERPRMRSAITTQLPPAPVLDVHDVRSISAGTRYACALRGDGTVACWGRQFGDDDDADRQPRATTISGLTGVTAVVVDRAACALRGKRDVWCWGPAEHGELGNGWAGAMASPHDIPGLTDATAIARSCAVRSTGAVACWGATPRGNYVPANDVAGTAHITAIAAIPSSQIDELATLDASGHVAVHRGATHPLALPTANAISARCAATRDGHAWCRPEPDHFDPNPKLPAPRPLPRIADATLVANTDTHACVAGKTGRVTCVFGTPMYDFKQPRLVEMRSAILALAIGKATDCAILGDRTVWCWDWDLEPFTHDTKVAFVPAAPLTMPHAIGVTDAVSIALDFDHGCAARSDGTVVCWGNNDHGQLGRTPLVARTQPLAPPTPVPGITDATAVTVGFFFTCALRSTGAVACWGDTSHGSVGTFATSYVRDPVAVTWR